MKYSNLHALFLTFFGCCAAVVTAEAMHTPSLPTDHGADASARRPGSSPLSSTVVDTPGALPQVSVPSTLNSEGGDPPAYLFSPHPYYSVPEAASQRGSVSSGAPQQRGEPLPPPPPPPGYFDPMTLMQMNPATLSQSLRQQSVPPQQHLALLRHRCGLPMIGGIPNGWDTRYGPVPNAMVPQAFYGLPPVPGMTMHVMPDPYRQMGVVSVAPPPMAPSMMMHHSQLPMPGAGQGRLLPPPPLLPSSTPMAPVTAVLPKAQRPVGVPKNPDTSRADEVYEMPVTLPGQPSAKFRREMGSAASSVSPKKGGALALPLDSVVARPSYTPSTVWHAVSSPEAEAAWKSSPTVSPEKKTRGGDERPIPYEEDVAGVLAGLASPPVQGAAQSSPFTPVTVTSLPTAEGIPAFSLFSTPISPSKTSIKSAPQADAKDVASSSIGSAPQGSSDGDAGDTRAAGDASSGVTVPSGGSSSPDEDEDLTPLSDEDEWSLGRLAGSAFGARFKEDEEETPDSPASPAETWTEISLKRGFFCNLAAADYANFQQLLMGTTDFVRFGKFLRFKHKERVAAPGVNAIWVNPGPSKDTRQPRRRSHKYSRLGNGAAQHSEAPATTKVFSSKAQIYHWLRDMFDLKGR